MKMREAKHDKLPLEIEEAHPPEWLSETHASADLGYIGYHPPRPRQEEDILTEANVKNGLHLPTPVSAETWGAQDLVKNRFSFENAVSELEDLMNQIFARRAEAVPAIPASTFRMPLRVTLNDSKRLAWFADLANPEVPLQKLSKSVPHGAKGHDLLDLLHSNNVAIPRAVWFLRVFGANEVAGLRHKPTYDPMQYSVEWANVVTSHLKKQLGDIVLPSAPRLGLNIKQTFKGVLSDPETRERWISRFTYSLELLRSFYDEGLVDNRTFLSWLVLQMCTCSLAQVGFVARLADVYLDGIVSCRALTRPFVDACLVKITEIRTTTAREYLTNVEAKLKSFLQRSCLVLPDAFVSPRMWITHAPLLNELLNRDLSGPHADRSNEVVSHLLAENFSDIQKRNDAMWFRNLPPRVLARLTEAVTDVSRLNSIGPTSDLSTFPYFPSTPSSTPSKLFTHKLDRLLTWAVTPLQYGDHRPYAAVTLLRRHRARAARRVLDADSGVQDMLFAWLDAAPRAHLPAVALLFGELIREGMFEYAAYVQRLIARGEQGLSYAEEGEGSRHRDFMTWIPLHGSTAAVINQRRVTLYGVRARGTPEESNEREMRREVRLLLPELFSVSSESLDATQTLGMAPSLTTCQILLGAPRYQVVRTIRQWLLPILLKRLPGHLEDPATHAHILPTYCMSVSLMALAKCYRAILDLSLAILEHPCAPECLVILVETLRRYTTIWASMDVQKDITLALYSTHQACKARGLLSRVLLNLVIEMDSGRYLDITARKAIEAEISGYALALRPADSSPEAVPTHLQEILLLPNDPRPEAGSMLANSLWYRYRTASDWAWRVWDNTFASLRVTLPAPLDPTATRARALCYANFLNHVDQHLPNGLDEHIYQWLVGPGIAELIAIDGNAWNTVTITLLCLVVQGVLSTTTVLRGLVYPLWSYALSDNGQLSSQPSDVYLRAAYDIFSRLVLRTEWGAGDLLPPVDFIELQRIIARRQDVFYEPHLTLLVANIPTLVFLEHSTHVPEELRPLSAAMRQAVCEAVEFRKGIYRDLNAARDAFEHSLQYDTLDESLVEPLMDALRLILNVARTDTATIGSSEWLDTSALLSPWKLAATAIEVQFSLKQMGERLALGTPHTHGNTKVDKLIAQFMHHHMSTEEADFVAEMARGVGPTIACKFVNTGFLCIASILDSAQTPLTSKGIQEVVEVASEQLRLLAHVVELVRDDHTPLPSVDSVAQDKFITALAGKIEAFEALIMHGPTSHTDIQPSQATQGAVLMVRLLQFNLGCKGMWTPKTRSLSNNLCSSVFNLTLAHGAGDYLNTAAFPLFLDTFMYLLDEIAYDTKIATSELFRNYPQIRLVDLPSDMPAEYRQQLRGFLPHPPSSEAVADLAYASRDASGQLVVGAAVVNRPWEWVENLGDPIPDAKDDKQVEDQHGRKNAAIVKNTSAMSLELFSARATGDAIAKRTGDAQADSSAFLFQDNLSGESVFARDWMETRVDLVGEATNGPSRVRGEEEDEVGALPSFAQNMGGTEQRRKPSPASSVRSRGSARMSASSSRLQSPAGHFSHVPSTRSEDPIEVDKAGTSSTTSSNRQPKRKASILSISSDGIEIVEDVDKSSQPPAKKAKGKAPAKPRAKKK
ncbi:hypothetical protein BV25DRAFT_1904185 [Artomyces pyxidatus]|uniref:Uncharacterized protein n=1 Tax=Artomyces pyxidatus TaxID=48021 RepID=A0ACB8TKC4_9AGAM|nr:hypothetical protein BV25DRAFT_1904185 [Artomyces pyxidatus]